MSGVFVFIFFSTQVFARWELPNTPASGIGDPGSFYLNEPGITLHVHNNDYLGRTDKLMTGSSNLFMYALSPDERNGMEFSLHRRLTTPLIKARYGEEPLSSPRGVFADQLEMRLGYSYMSTKFKIELAASYEHYGNLKGDNILKFLHELTHSSTQSISAGEKIQNDYLAGAVGFGYLTCPVLWMVYFRDSPVMRDALARMNIKFGTKDVQFALQAEAALQIQSDFYGHDIEEWRYGSGMSFKWYWYQISAGYVSQYLKYDKFGQFYLSPLIISYEF